MPVGQPGGPGSDPALLWRVRGALEPATVGARTRTVMADEQDDNPTASLGGDSVTLAQLHHLLAIEHETGALDFKETCDLSDRRAIVEMAKDVGAMQIDGGWIVIGADNSGVPVPPGIADKDRQLFDEANLTPKLAKYIPGPFELHTAIHVIDGCTLAVIRVVPRVDGFCVFAADGTYDNNGKQVVVFRKGDVFARHGTANERWIQADIARIRSNMATSLKESWWAEREEDQRGREDIAHGAAQVVASPLANYTWRVDAPTFDAATLELFRANDDIPLRRVLNDAASDAGVLADSGDIDELTTIIGRVVSIAAQAVTYKRSGWFNESLATLARIYGFGFDARGSNRNNATSEDLWLVLLEHILALGALAERKNDWAAVQALAVTPPGGDSEYYASWMRHALTMAARSRRLDDGTALVTRAAERVGELPALHPDIAPGTDEVLSSICRFDLLAVLAIIAETENRSDGGWYPNFARFYTQRSEPAVQKLLTDTAMRSIIFPLSDDDLAAALREVNRMSFSEGRRFNGWSGFDSTAVETFLKAHPPPPPA